MRTVLAGVTLALTLLGGFAVAQTTVPPNQPRIVPRVATAPTASVCRNVNDCDGDGENSIARGGLDCDDNNANRRPGATEVADNGDIDEDCDPTTYGTRDADQDGFYDAQARNVINGVVTSHGNDCDDRAAHIRPSAQELPNRLDDDCNGRIDDLAGGWWTPAN